MNESDCFCISLSALATLVSFCPNQKELKSNQLLWLLLYFVFTLLLLEVFPLGHLPPVFLVFWINNFKSIIFSKCHFPDSHRFLCNKIVVNYKYFTVSHMVVFSVIQDRSPHLSLFPNIAAPYSFIIVYSKIFLVWPGKLLCIMQTWQIYLEVCTVLKTPSSFSGQSSHW